MFLGEVDKGSGDIGVVRDEATVEVCKAQKGPNNFDFLGIQLEEHKTIVNQN